jgi:hypothetical protein
MTYPKGDAKSACRIQWLSAVGFPTVLLTERLKFDREFIRERVKGARRRAPVAGTEADSTS